jgi:SGNH domain (fused to AT3 domains)
MQHNATTLEALRADRSVTTVVLSARYATHLAIDADKVSRGLRQSVEALTAAGKQVWLVEPFPDYEYPVPEALGLRHYRGTAPEGFGQPLAAYRQRHAADLQLVRSLSAVPGTHVFRPSDALCPEGWCSTLSHRQVLYFDEHHPSMAGARLVAAGLAAALRGSTCPPCVVNVAAKSE